MESTNNFLILVLVLLAVVGRQVLLKNLKKDLKKDLEKLSPEGEEARRSLERRRRLLSALPFVFWVVGGLILILLVTSL